MSKTPRDLPVVQRWLQSVITHPEGVAEGVGSDAAQREIAVDVAGVEQVILPSRTMSSIERLAVYGNAYVARLLECLEEEYPALVFAIGEEAFAGLAFSYLQAHPSQSYTLADLGDRFPSFLDATRPDRDADTASWTTFLVDLAVLERAYSKVFDGPGPEGKRLLQTEDVAAIPPAQWPQAKLVTPPWLRLLTFRFPVHEFASAVRVREEAPAPPDAAVTHLAITRRDYVVRRTPLSAIQHVMLTALMSGEAISDALMLVAESEHFDGDIAKLADDVRRWFHDWTAAGFFEAVQLP